MTLASSLPALALIWAALSRITYSLKLSSDANASNLLQLSSGSNASSKLFTYGSTVAIFNPLHKRLMRMNKGHNTMDATGVFGGVPTVEAGYTWERFTIVDAGNGRIALHNSINNRFIGMHGEQVRPSPIKAANHLPHGWGAEFFEIVDAGDGKVGIHSPANNRFLEMQPSGHVKGSPHCNAHQLPHGWTWQQFYLVPSRPYLVPGSVVALYNKIHNRFLRMHSTFMDGSGHPPHPPNFPSNWDWERFKVVDAGNGRISLHSHRFQRFVKMDGHSVTVSPHSDGSHWPQGWHSEAFVPIPINPNENEIILWHPDILHTITMHGQQVTRSPAIQAQDLPTGWTWQTFKVVVLSDPPR